jgi:hypothetical protein
MTIILFIVLFVLLLVAGYLMQRKTKHYDGQIIITTNEVGKHIFSLELDIDPYELKNMDVVSFKVTDKASPDYDDI